MTKGNSSADGVDLFEWNLEVLNRHDGLRGEGFVDLPEVDIVLADTGFLERLGNGKGWSDTAMRCKLL